MPTNRLQPLNLMDYTGGVNLRPETFQLQENELPDLLNMEVDPKGGLNTRRGWKAQGNTVAVAGVWNPRNAFLARKSDNSQFIYISNEANLYAQATNGVWSSIAGTCNADPHGADFASWGDEVFVVRGWGDQAGTVNGTTFTALTASAAANWQNDYTVPGSTNTCPRAELVAQHSGYMFVAVTGEDLVKYPSRLRWSHPNNPKRWAKEDYIDINEGGQRITAIIPFSDRLVIFKPDSVWALYGYSSETWELANISRTIGCVNQQCVARTEVAVFFLSWPHGVFSCNEAGTTEEVSMQIRPVFQTHQIDPAAVKNSWLGWVGRRLWCSLPYNEGEAKPTSAETVFVFDPAMESWTVFRGAEDCVPGPYIERVEIEHEDNQLAVARTDQYLIALDANDQTAEDECTPGMVHPFTTRMRTRWVDAGAPTWRKSWRRPDLLLRALKIDSSVNVQVFHDFDSSNAQRSFVVAYTPENPPSFWGDFNYGDGDVYGGALQTSSVERGGTMGRAGSIQLLATGFNGVAWGLNGIILKFIARRFR